MPNVQMIAQWQWPFGKDRPGVQNVSEILAFAAPDALPEDLSIWTQNVSESTTAQTLLESRILRGAQHGPKAAGTLEQESGLGCIRRGRSTQILTSLGISQKWMHIFLAALALAERIAEGIDTTPALGLPNDVELHDKMASQQLTAIASACSSIWHQCPNLHPQDECCKVRPGELADMRRLRFSDVRLEISHFLLNTESLAGENQEERGVSSDACEQCLGARDGIACKHENAEVARQQVLSLLAGAIAVFGQNTALPC